MTSMVDMNTRHGRIMWLGVCWVLSGVLAGFGLVYAILGIRATPAPSVYAAVTQHLPGGIHTYGTVMVLLSLALVHGLAPAWHRRPIYSRWLHAVLYGVVSFAACAMANFAWSWAMTGKPSYGAIIYWLSILAFAFLAAQNGPVDDRPRRAHP